MLAEKTKTIIECLSILYNKFYRRTMRIPESIPFFLFGCCPCDKISNNDRGYQLGATKMKVKQVTKKIFLLFPSIVCHNVIGATITFILDSIYFSEKNDLFMI